LSVLHYSANFLPLLFYHFSHLLSSFFICIFTYSSILFVLLASCLFMLFCLFSYFILSSVFSFHLYSLPCLL
jgi:hypothetical protein